MKTLTPSLVVAQRSSSSRPFVRARFQDFQGDRPRLRPVRHYTGGEASADHAVLVTTAGTLLRARTLAGPALRVNRVTNPTPASDFATDVQVATNVGLGQGIALTQATTGTVWLFYLGADTITIHYRTSADDGASWSAEATSTVAGGAVFNLCAAAGASGTIALAVTFSTNQVFTWRWDGAAFTTPALWPHTPASVNGLAMSFQFDWQMVVTGVNASPAGPRVWTGIYGAGVDVTLGSWSNLTTLQAAADGSGISFDSPFAGQVSGFWRVTYVEIFAGPVAYNRVFWCSMNAQNNFLQELWSEPMPFDYAAANVAGVAVAGPAGSGSTPARLWLSRPDGVWSSASPANPELDVSAGVIEASVTVDERGARVRLVLDNSAKAPGMPWPGGWLPTGVLRRGARLQLTPGYRTIAGDEAPLPYSYWVESIEQTWATEERRLVVHARDAWWLLESWEARRSFVWTLGERTLSQLMLFILSRAALETSTASASSFYTSHAPAFTVHPGQTGKVAVERLLANVEDVAYFNGANLVVGVAGLGDPVDYAIGATGPPHARGIHAITGIVYRDTPPDASQSRVQGLGTFDAAFDFGEIETHGERIAQAFNINLDAGSEAIAVAAALLRKAQLAARSDEFEVFGVHCGVELYDVIEVTQPAEFPSPAFKRRVRGYSWRYETGRRGRYDMQLELGAV